MNYFVVSLDENGEPDQVCGPGTLQVCKKFAAVIARDWGVSEDKIKADIFDSDMPGLFSEQKGLVHGAFGVFVLPGDRLPAENA